jgi:hypothetical protein
MTFFQILATLGIAVTIMFLLALLQIDNEEDNE